MNGSTVSRRLRKLGLLAASVALSVAITAAMSWLLRGAVYVDMLITGFVAALLVTLLVGRITRHYRRRIYALNAELEARVVARTQALQQAHDELAAEHTAREALRAKLAVYDRLAVAGTLAAGVGHEIRNPLSGVLAMLELAAERVERGPIDVDALRQELALAKEGADRVVEVTRDLDALARPSDETPEALDLHALLPRIVRLAAPSVRARCRVSVDVQGLPPVLFTESRVYQVVLNLLVNAAHAAAPGGRGVVRVTGEDCGDHVCVHVADDGCGMSAEVLERALEPFYTTREGRGGTGLGLHLCRTIMEAADGGLTLASTEGVGTTVTLRFPRAWPESGAIAAARGQAAR